MYNNVIYSINRDNDKNKFFIPYGGFGAVRVLGGVGLDEQYFGCSNVNAKCSKRTVFDYVCRVPSRFKDNYSKLIPSPLSILYMVLRL